MKLLIFDILGDFAHFRRFYTTSSALSFSFPPPPTIRGMLGAILGLPKETHKKETENFYVGCSILKMQRKIRMTFNQRVIQDKKYKINEDQPVRTQTRIEFLRNPKFRIYVMSDDKKMDTLIERVKNKESYYTLSLGLAECFAKLEYIDDLEVINNGKGARLIKECNFIHSIIPVNIVKLFSTAGTSVLRENSVPIKMLDDRTVTMYEDVLCTIKPTKNPLKGQFINLSNQGELVQYTNKRSGNLVNIYVWSGK